MRRTLWSAALVTCALASTCDGTGIPRASVKPPSVREVAPPSVWQLKTAIQRGTPEERIAAARAFPDRGRDVEDAVPLLVESLKDEDPAVVDALRRALDSIPTAPRSSVIRLRCALRENFAAVRLGAVEALSRMGPDSAEAIPELVGSLADRDCSVRVAAMDALVRIGSKSVAPLLEALVDHEPGLGRPIVQALGRILPDGPEALASMGEPIIEQLLAMDD
jgi:HEAT repeat protein